MPSKKELQETIDTQEAQHQDAVAAFQRQLAAKDKQHVEALAKKSEECASLLGEKVEEQAGLKAAHANQIENIKQQHTDQIQVLEQQLAKQIAESTSQISALKADVVARDAQIVELRQEINVEISMHKKTNADDARAHASQLEDIAKKQAIKYQQYTDSVEELRRNHAANKAMNQRVHADLVEAWGH